MAAAQRVRAAYSASTASAMHMHSPTAATSTPSPRSMYRHTYLYSTYFIAHVLAKGGQWPPCVDSDSIRRVTQLGRCRCQQAADPIISQARLCAPQQQLQLAWHPTCTPHAARSAAPYKPASCCATTTATASPPYSCCSTSLAEAASAASGRPCAPRQVPPTHPGHST